MTPERYPVEDPDDRDDFEDWVARMEYEDMQASWAEDEILRVDPEHGDGRE